MSSFACKASIVLLVALAAPAAAQEMTGPPPQAQGLQEMVGNWTGTGTVSMPDGSTAPVTGTQTCASAAAGWGVACNISMTGLPGGGSFEVAALWGYNQGDGMYHFYAVTNHGDVHDHYGAIGPDGTMTLEHQGPWQGQLFSERIVSTPTENGIAFHVTMMLGNQNMGTMDLTLTKQ